MAEALSRVAAGLSSLGALEGYALDAASRRAFDGALALVSGLGCRRLTTTFLLFSMADGTGPAAGDPLSRFLHHKIGGAEAYSYRGAKKAYIGWFLGDSRRCDSDLDAQAFYLTPYIPAVLDRAQQMSAAWSGDGLIRPAYLFSALLTYQPGEGSMQPGIQYIVDIVPPGRGPLIERFCEWLRATAGDDVDADRLAHWLAAT